MQQRRDWKGFAFGASAYAAWGLLPLYWKALERVAAFEILNYRILWSALTIAVTLTILGRWQRLRNAFANRRTVAMLAVSTLIISGNWLIFIYAVNSGHVLEVSLGYFINPILSVGLGVVLLRERLNRIQGLSAALALAGVAVQTIAYGEFPWIALALATTFGLYGLIRKVAAVDPLTGLAIEMLAIALPAMAYLSSLQLEEGWQGGWRLHLLLAASGPLTVLPLYCFAQGVKRLPLSTMGLLQYLAPSLQFALAVLFFGEAFTAVHLAAFLLIWAGLSTFSMDAVWRTRAARKEAWNPKHEARNAKH